MTGPKPVDPISRQHFKRLLLSAVISALMLGIIGMLLWRIHVSDERRQALIQEQFSTDSRVMAGSMKSLFSSNRKALNILTASRRIRGFFAAAGASASPEPDLEKARAQIEELFTQTLLTGTNSTGTFFDALALMDGAGNVVLQKSLTSMPGPDGNLTDQWHFSGCPCTHDAHEIILDDRELSRPCFVISQPIEIDGNHVGSILGRVPLHAYLVDIFGKENHPGERAYFLAYDKKFLFSRFGTAHTFPESFDQLDHTPRQITAPPYLAEMDNGWQGPSMGVRAYIPDTAFALITIAPRDALEGYPEFYLNLSVASLGALLLGTVALLGRSLTDRILLTARLQEQRQAAAQIRKHMEEFDLLFNALPGIAWRKDSEGRFVALNSAACDFFGQTREYILGKTLSELLPADLAGPLQEDELPLLRGECATSEKELEIDRFGRCIITRRMVAVTDAAGRVDGIIGLSMDVTQIKRAETLISRTAAFQKIIIELAVNFINRPIAELDQGLDEALALVANFYGVDRACIFSYDYAMEALNVSHEWSSPGTPSIREHIQNTPSSLFPGVVETHRAGKYMLIPSVASLPADAPLRKALEALGTKSVISMPLFHEKTCFGFVSFASINKEISWSENDIDLLVVTAGLLANARLRRLHEQSLMEARAIAEEAYNVMEKRIAERTCELANANIRLKSEITRRKQLIGDLETIQSAISAILVAVDGKGLVTRWSSAAEKAFDLPASRVLGSIFYSLPLSWDWDIVHGCVGECMSKKETSRVNNLRYANAAGRESILMLSVSPLFSKSRAEAGYLVLGEDVTEIKTLEAQLSQAAKMEAVGQLAAGIAHEINTPTQYVSDSVTFIREVFQELSTLFAPAEAFSTASTPPDPAVTEKMQMALRDIDFGFIQREMPSTFSRIETGIDKISAIVRAMNRFAHSGQNEKKMTDIGELLENALTISQNEWKYVAKLEKDLDQNLGCLMCHPGDISQVFLNVIINAAHAIEDTVRGKSKKGAIFVSTRKAGEWAEIRIRDTGTGIPEHARGKIFNLFFTTKTIGKGTGQGLAIAYNTIVNKHGGEITFDSKPGEGTTFIIRLPMTNPAF